MKNTIITSILLFVLMFQLLSCKKEDSKMQNKAIKTKTETKTVFDTIFDRKNPYYTFIKNNYPKALSLEVMSFRGEDIDLDGKKEALIVFGSQFDGTLYADYIFLLKNNHGIVKEVKSDFDLENIPILQANFISLKGEKKKYIYIGLLDPPTFKGFSIYELVGDEIKKKFVSASIGLERHQYDDKLIDVNLDNQYDGYVQNIKYHFLTIKNIYDFDNGNFKFKKTDYVLGDYPDDIECVINLYIGIRSLNTSDKKVSQRLKELCLDENANQRLLNKEIWSLIFENYSSTIKPLEISINEDEAIAITSLDFKDLNYQLRFELKETNDKWQITKIEVIK